MKFQLTFTLMIFYPPFNEHKIDSVKNFIANVGKLEKSSVSNKNLKE